MKITSRGCIAGIAIVTLLAVVPNAWTAEPTARLITADYSDIKGTNSHYEALCVGAGRAGEILRKAAVDQLGDVHENCGFKYLRFHGLFHEDMAVYSEEAGKPIHNFQYVDLVYDTILEKGMRPFVELGFMPEALSSGSKCVFWWKANVTTPKNYDLWGGLVRDFTAHMQERYGREEVKQWFFEVWNEPNYPAFFSGNMNDYFHLYDVSAQAVKSVCPDYPVGGPATAGNGWVRELIQHCTTNKVPLDFISTHTYGVTSLMDEFGKMEDFLLPGDTVISDPVKKVHEQIASSAMPQLPLYYTEWSTSSSSRDPVHDSYVSAPYILNTLKRCNGYAKAMSYWTYTDVFEEAGPPPTPFHGGFGLINLQGLHKPSYFAYKFLHALGDTELACNDPSATVCRSEKGVQALVWNYTTLKQDACNRVFFKRDLPAKQIEPVELVLKHLPSGSYDLKIYCVGYHRNDVYGAFLAMGSPANPTREQVATLAKASNGEPMSTESIQVTSAGEFHHKLEMRQNDAYLVILERKGT